MNVLIVDDSKAMRMLLRQAIRSAGFSTSEVREAEDGNKALSLIEAKSPDLLLTDWNMPSMGGHELLTNARAGRFRGKAIVVSSAASPDMRAVAMGAGADAVLQKPFNPVSIRAALTDVGFKPTTNVKGGGADANQPIDLTVAGVRSALAGCYRQQVTVTPGSEMDLRSVSPCAHAVFEEGGHIVAVAVMEAEIAACLAAAISLLPKGIVRDAVKGDAPANLLGNVNEVFNLLARVVGLDGRAATLKQVEFGGDVPIFARAFSRKAEQVLDVRIEVDGYGKGAVHLAVSHPE